MNIDKQPERNEIARPAEPIPLGWPPENVLMQKHAFRRAIVWDCHGPLYDWSTTFCEVAGELYKVQLDPSQVMHYYMGFDRNFPLSAKQFRYAFKHMVRLRQGYGWLKAQPHAIETVRTLQESGIGQEIWTYVPGASDYTDSTLVAVGTGLSQGETFKLIARDFPFLGNPKDVVRFIKPGEKAPAMARDGYPLLVEDCASTAVAASEHGLAAVLVVEPYNQYTFSNGIYRLGDRSQLLPVLLDFDKSMQEAGAYEFGR